MGQQQQEQKYAGRRYVGARAVRVMKWLGQTGREVYNLFLGDRLILIGIPLLLLATYLLYYHFATFAESSYLFIFQNGALVLIGSILGLITLSCFYYISGNRHQHDNTQRQSPDNSYQFPLFTYANQSHPTPEPEPEEEYGYDDPEIVKGGQNMNPEIAPAPTVMTLGAAAELRLPLEAENRQRI